MQAPPRLSTGAFSLALRTTQGLLSSQDILYNNIVSTMESCHVLKGWLFICCMMTNSERQNECIKKKTFFDSSLLVMSLTLRRVT